MTLSRAMRLAIEAMRAEVKHIAFDANLCDRLSLKEPGTVKASRRRRELLAACDVLATLTNTSKPETTNTGGRGEV